MKPFAGYSDYRYTSGTTLKDICVVSVGEHGRMVIESGLTGEQAGLCAKRIAARGRSYIIVDAESLAEIIAKGLTLKA